MGKNPRTRKRHASDEDSELSDETIEISNKEPPEKRLRTSRFSEQRPSNSGGAFMTSSPRSNLGSFGRHWGDHPFREYPSVFHRSPDGRYAGGLFGRPDAGGFFDRYENRRSSPSTRERSPARMGYLSGQGRESNPYSLVFEYDDEENLKRYIDEKVEEKVNGQLAIMWRNEKRTN